MLAVMVRAFITFIGSLDVPLLEEIIYSVPLEISLDECYVVAVHPYLASHVGIEQASDQLIKTFLVLVNLNLLFQL